MTGLADLRVDPHSGALHVRRRLAPGPAEPARLGLPVLPRRARGARDATTCAGSRTAGRRCPRAAARSCSTRRATTPRSGRSGRTAPCAVIDLWAERTAALGAHRGRRLRARVREPRAGGGLDDHAPARADLRVRLRARAAAARARARRAVHRSRRPARRHRARLAGVGAGGADVPVRAAAGAGRRRARPAVARPRRPARARPAARRRARAARPPVPGADAVHDVDPPAAVRRRRLAGCPAARGDRVAVARGRRAALRRGRRARLGRVLQPGGARGRGARAARGAPRERARDAAAPRRRAQLGEPGADEPEPRAGERDARSATARCRSTGRGSFALVARPEDAPARRRLERGRGAGPVDDAGLRRAAVHEREDAVRRAAADGARREPDRRLPAPVRGPGRVARPPRRAALRRQPRARCTSSSTASRSGSPRTRARRPSSTSRTCVRHGAENELVAAVVQWSDASFVEDQDQWWHAGLPRSVVLYATPRAYVADVFARGDMDGRLVVDVRTEGGRARRTRS